MTRGSIKKVLTLAISVILIATMIYNPAFAAATTKALSTNFTLVNLGSDKADVLVDYLLPNGTPWPNVASGNKSFQLDPDGGQKQIRQYTDTMNPGSGSAVVSSTMTLGAVVQIQARASKTATNGAYIGASEGSAVSYVPLVAHRANGASGVVNSQIIIQNAGPDPVTFDVEFFPLPGYTGNPVKHVTTPLAVGASYYYDIEAETALASTGWFGSAVVRSTSSGGLLVVVSNLFTGADGMQTFNAFPEKSLTDTWVVPLFTSKLANGLSTVVTVQNLNGAEFAINDLVLTCKQETDTPTTPPLELKNTTAVPNNASYSFNPVGNASYPNGYAGACVMKAPADSKVVTMVQMRYVGVKGIANAATYEAIPANLTSTSSFIPLVAKRLSNGFATVVNIANLSSDPNKVDIVYNPSPTECPVATCDKNDDGKVGPEDAIKYLGVDIPANGGIQRNHRTNVSDPLLPDGWVGSLKVTSTVGKPIGAIVQLTNIKPLVGDSLMAHDAFNQ